MGFSRKIPLKKLLHKITIEALEPYIFRVNFIVTETYKFLKLFFISKLEKNETLPLIDQNLMNNIYSLVSIRRQKFKGKKVEGVESFYETVYSKIQPQKVNGGLLKQALNEETLQIITAIENLCNFNYYDYVKLLSKCCLKLHGEKNYKLVYKLAKSLYKDEVIKGCEPFQQFIQEWKGTVQEGLGKTGQERLPFMYKILQFVESQNLPEKQLKLLNLLPLRTSLIPCSVRVTKSSCKEDLKDEGIWNSISKRVAKKFKNETKCETFSSFRTDGIYASLYFGKGTRYTKGTTKPKKKVVNEVYVEDYDWSEETRRTVQIDPNKWNLLFCLDGQGENLRYTQVSRRKFQKKTRYKQIRKEIEAPLKQELEDMTEQLKTCNKKTIIFEKFKEYLIVKTKQEKLFSDLYHNLTFRKLRFNSWMNTKRSEDLFVKKFKEVYGDNSETIVTIGDWEQKKKISFGKEPTIGKGLRDVFRKYHYTVLLVNESCTSKQCWRCKDKEADNEYNFKERVDPRPWKQGMSQKVWGLSRCTKCGVIHNRDMNAVKNIRQIVKAHRRGLERPEYLNCKSISLKPSGASFTVT